MWLRAKNTSVTELVRHKTTEGSVIEFIWYWMSQHDMIKKIIAQSYKWIHHDYTVYKNSKAIIGLGRKKESCQAFYLCTWGIEVTCIFLFFFASQWFIHAVLLVAQQGGMTDITDFLEFLQKKYQKNDSNGCRVHTYCADLNDKSKSWAPSSGFLNR